MSVRTDIVKSKLENNLYPAVEDLKNSAKVIHRVGGTTKRSHKVEIEFQQTRIDNLEWCLEATEDEIKEVYDELIDTLEEDEKGCLYGNMRGLPKEVVEKLIKVEDFQLALGIHPILD